MGLYIFENNITHEVKDFFFHMNDEKKVDGWTRLYTIPTASIDTKINPNSANSFIDQTRKKNYSIGDLWSKSAELSEKRGGDANDPVKKKALDSYKKKTGKSHPSLNKTGTIEI